MLLLVLSCTCHRLSIGRCGLICEVYSLLYQILFLRILLLRSCYSMRWLFLLVLDIVYHFSYFLCDNIIQLLLSFAFSCRELVPNFVCFLNLLLVLQVSLFVTGWVDKFVSSHSSTLKLEAFLKKLLLLYFSLFWSHLGDFTGKNSVLNFFSSLFYYLLPFGVTEI